MPFVIIHVLCGLYMWLIVVLGYGDEEDRGELPNQMGDALPFVDLGSDFIPIQGLHSVY